MNEASSLSRNTYLLLCASFSRVMFKYDYIHQFDSINGWLITFLFGSEVIKLFDKYGMKKMFFVICNRNS